MMRLEEKKHEAYVSHLCHLKESCRTESIKMDTSKLPKIQDAERESQFGYVHGVSGPGLFH